MNSFRISTGQCLLTDDELWIDTSVRGTIRRIYEGSKLFFTIELIVVIWAVVSLIIDTGVFSRELAPGALVIGVFIGGSVGILWLLSVTSGNLTRDTVISFDAIESIECSEGGLFPSMIVKYRKNESDVRRLLQFPYSWFSYTHDEFEKAKTIFEQNNIELTEGNSTHRV